MQVYNFRFIFHTCFVRRAVLEVQLLIICPSSYTYTSYNFNIQVKYSNLPTIYMGTNYA